MSASSIYADLPLDPARSQIRVLDILPSEQQDGGSADHVHCRLHRVDLSSEPGFSALSYAWGDEPTRVDVNVNGVFMPVTVNLGYALKHLRRPDRVVTVWADALCINQVDDIEKGHQVKRMHDVYSRAKRTIVWLGPVADGSDMAMRVLQDTGSKALNLGILNHTAPAVDAGFAGEDAEFHGLRLLVEAIGWAYPFKAVRKLCERQYWSRLWVQQEYALAQKIMIQCGSRIMDSDEYNAAFLLLPYLQKHLIETAEEVDDYLIPVQTGTDYEVDTDKDGRPLSRVWHMLKNGVVARAGKLIGTRRLYETWQRRANMSPQRRLCALLESANSQGTETSALGVRNPRDRIFGLLGMLGQNAVLGFEVDYRKSEEEVYTSVTRWLLICGQLSLLSYAQIRSGPLMPSWSPVWGSQLRAPTIERGLFNSSGPQQAHAVPVGGNTNRELRFKGVLLDSVLWRGGSWQPENYGEDFPYAEASRFLAEVEAMIVDQSGVLYGMSMEQWQEGLWRIPIADQYTNDTGMCIRATTAAKVGWEMVKLGQAAQSVKTSALNWYQIAMSRLHGRRLARTRKGLLGLMPADVEVGDIVSILVGAEAPLLLRPETQGSAYKIVGESYLYGVMDGEAITKDTVFTDIDIC
ncbi:hypothetical protein LTR15_012950 [Elasticomyces elasticus]|nr:hypothetical protein LTR15_012950 [Elasticomyces elasticus]